MPTPEKPHYRKTHYWSDLRVHGYSNQLAELYRLDPESALEIGMADGFMNEVVGRFTRHRLVSCDLDASLRPNVAGSVLQLPFGRNEFDLVMCCQVLEHIPFTEFVPALQELRRVARRAILLSVPDVRMYFALRLRLPRAGWKTLSVSPERYRLGPYEYDGEHYWEIGFRGTRFKDIRAGIRSAGLEIVRSYRIPDLPYHCCFLLDPREPK